MNRNFKFNGFYFYMAIVGAAMVPVMANAQSAPDNGDGPRVVYYDEDQVPTAPVTSGYGSPAPARPTAASGQSGAAAPAAPSGSGDANQPNAYLGGSMNGSANQGFNVGAQGGYYNHGANVGGEATLGHQGNIFQAGVVANNVRTNGYDTQSFTVAGLVNGTAHYGSSGQYTANGVVGAVAVIPFGSGNWRCSILAGPVGGGMASNALATDTTSAAAGPGGYVGIPCDIGGLSLVAGNHTLFNALNASDPSNPTKAAGQFNASLMYRLSPNAALGADARVNYDVRGDKTVADWQAGGFLRYTWDVGGRNNPPARAAQ